MNTIIIPKISLAAARVNARMTEKELANYVGVDTSTTAKWENGKTEPTLSQLRMISQVSKIPMDFIYMPDKS